MMHNKRDIFKKLFLAPLTANNPCSKNVIIRDLLQYDDVMLSVPAILQQCELNLSSLKVDLGQTFQAGIVYVDGEWW